MFNDGDSSFLSTASAMVVGGGGGASDGFGISSFSGDDKTYSSTKWARDIEDHAEIFEWSAQQMLIMARRSLTGTAALWLRSEGVFKSYEDLKTAIQLEFPDAVNPKEMHEIMARRRKLKGETYVQYLFTMKELGKRAKFPEYVVIQYVIDGIQDQEMNKAVLYGASTYAEFKEKLLIYEQIKDKTGSVQAVPGGKPDRLQTVRARQQRCFSCGEAGHKAGACIKGLKCFRCNLFGHIGSRCNNVGDASGKAEVPSTSKPSGVTTRSMLQDGGNRSKSLNQDQYRSKKQAMFAATNQEFDTTCEHSNESDVFKMVDTAETNQSLFFMNERNEVSNEFKQDLTDKCQQNKDVNNGLSKNKKSILSVNLCGKIVDALIDSGSDGNLVSSELYDQIDVAAMYDDVIFSGLGKLNVKSEGKFVTNITIDGQLFESVTFHVLPRNFMPYSVIIGQEFLKGVKMVMCKGSVRLLKDEGDDWWRSMDGIVNVNSVNFSIGTTSALRNEVLQCIENYNPTQTKEAPIELRLVLKDDIPVMQRPRRISLKEQRIVEEQIDEWLNNEIIRVSYSEYSSPLVLVKKKDGSIRICVDYRLINKKILKDEFPLPVIEDLIDKVRCAKVFSVLDLKNGFFHLKVNEDSVKYTSFVTHHGQFEFLRAPFGLSVCPKYFMRFITIIFRDLIAKGIVVIFIDDILISAKDEAEAVDRLKLVLDVASEYGLQINWKKAKLICREIEFLGHIIKDGEVRPSAEKTEAVIKYPEPKTAKQLQSFLGLTSYFRKYIENYAVIARPLSNLLKKNINFVLNEEQRNAFSQLKGILGSKPVLKIFDPRLKTELHTDASSIAYAAILMQYHPNSGLHPVHYMSRKTNEAEAKYSSYELEALAIVQGMKKFRHYLFGIKFKIVTDCQAFEMTLRKKDLTPKVARWVLMLDEYDYTVEHRSGSRLRHTDALSRNPCIVAAVMTLHEEIKLAQDSDDGTKAIKDILKLNSYQDYWLENDILYKGEEKKLVVPRSLEKEIIKRTHGVGHFSKRKMKELITRDYYVKDVDRKIEEFIISCVPCLLATRKEGKQEGFLSPIEKENIPLDTIHVDHIGPLLATKKQYNYILTIVDAFTKFVWLFPTKTTSSTETLNKLYVHQQTFGNPRRIITDRGSAFTSREFEEYCNEENIKHIKITTGVPRGNGQVERIHRIIIPVLTKLCLENNSLWFRHVSRVQRALNCTFQRSIGMAPFELLIGTKMKNKEDVELVNMLQQETAEQYCENRINLQMQAKEQILKIQEENRLSYNKRRKASSTYKVDDLVAIKRTQFGSGLKLAAKYLGPYRVTKVKHNDRYDLEKLSSAIEGPNKTSSSADQMKRWPGENRSE